MQALSLSNKIATQRDSINSSRRRDVRIRELRAKVAASKDPDEVSLILPELKSAIHQAIERLRLGAVAVLSGPGDFQNEKRKTY
jgi:hypothetical protein